jgi:Fic family protein
MKQGQPAKKPAKKGKHTPYNLSPVLPGKGSMGRLKDMAQEIISASAGLEGRVAAETALALGDRLRLINSYYSNLIEGHKTTIPDIEAALRKDFHQDPEEQYAQELCAAHVETERRFMQWIEGGHAPNICNKRYLCDMHAAFYANLPKDHLFTHAEEGFTEFPVYPGVIRDVNVSVDGQSIHGPDHEDLPALLEEFARVYNPDHSHGDERLIAMAASHHRLTWLHPFRDGNGRVTRLFSVLYLARAGVNRSNLWSLSRGLSREKKQYMFELWATDSPNAKRGAHYFDDDLLAGFCMFFFKICLDQIRFMEGLLRLDRVESRIDWYVEMRAKQADNPLRAEAAKLLRAAFMRGAVPRGAASEILNMSERNARRIVSALLKDGLLQSSSHRSPLTIGLPMHVLAFYFPSLYDPSVIGEEYLGSAERSVKGQAHL